MAAPTQDDYQPRGFWEHLFGFFISNRLVVGIFLFRTPNQIFANLPLVKFFLPGSERGLIGAYFEVKGPVNEPDVDALPLQTLMSSVPDAIKAPFKVMRFLFNRGSDD